MIGAIRAAAEMRDRIKRNHYTWTRVGASAVTDPQGQTTVEFYPKQERPLSKHEMIDSTSDQRTVNNTLRHQYRVLTEAEKALVAEVKDKGAEIINLLHKIGGTGPYLPAGAPSRSPESFGSANLSLSFRHIEDAVYRAVKHITE